MAKKRITNAQFTIYDAQLTLIMAFHFESHIVNWELCIIFHTSSLHSPSMFTAGKHRYLYWIAGLAVLGYIIIEATGPGDFRVFLEAAKRLHDGGDIYGSQTP